MTLFLFVLQANAIAAKSQLQVFTSTRCVTSLAVTSKGVLWVGTRGGVLQRDVEGKWKKYTRADGLPDNEVRQILIENGDSIKVLFPSGTATWKSQNWVMQKSTFAPVKEFQLPSVQWQNKTVQATWNGLQIGDQYIKMPSSTGSYISALLPQEKVLLAAIYGDGIWSFDGIRWAKRYISLPLQARQITALAISADAEVLFVGTRRDGVWILENGKWQQHLEPGEPYNDNIQNLISYQGNLFASTLEDGLVEYTNGRWIHYDERTLSSNAPRQMAVFHDHLYVRFGNGKVDRFDGEHWQRDVFPNLPRGKVYSIAADEKKLYIGQWGGWSEWDGKVWTHHLKIPQLQGIPIILLHSIGNSLWIGTQSLGIARFDDYKSLPFYGIPGAFNPSTKGPFQIFDERQGLPDDWITAIAGNSLGNMFVGTFVGGLATRSGLGWETFTPVAGENVTALQMDKRGGVYIATRHGVWHKDNFGIWKNYQKYFPYLAPEAQALLDTPEGLWIGTRTGLYLVTAS